MRVIVQTQPGGAETLRLAEIPVPTPGPTELLVRVRAAGVNRADLVQRMGRYPPPPGAPDGLGLEIAGEVTATGEAVQDFAFGDAVFGLVAGGGYAEYALLDAALAIRKPASWSWALAAAVPEAWMTAWFNLVEGAALAAGETLLVHAGASGVGTAAIQLGVWRGARVWTTVGSVEKAAFCRALGAEHAWNYRETAFHIEARAQGGADVILDCVGAPYLEGNLATLKSDGRLILIGLMGGTRSEIPLGTVLMKRLRLQGSTLRSQPLAVKARLAAALRDTLLPAMLEGVLRTPLAATFPLASAADAHRYVEANRNLGKVVLTLDD
jgi:NADPH2:quinone reductase